MQYHIFSDIDELRMINLVNQKMKEGWILQGGIAATGGFHETTEYFQAMCKKTGLPVVHVD